MKKYKALLFDFDDTLFDFNKSEKIALEKTFNRYGIEKSEYNFEIYYSENHKFWKGFEKGIYKGEQDSDIRFKNFCEIIGRNEINCTEMCNYYIEELSKTAFAIDNSVEMLEKYCKVFDIYIVTNALKRVNDKRSEVGGIMPFIKGRFISEEIGYSKPNKEFFDYLFSKVNFSKEQCLLIGDGLMSDMKGGVDYGIDTCWFNRKGAVSDMPLTYEVHSIAELDKLLKESSETDENSCS